jgi:hypothetical protein
MIFERVFVMRLASVETIFPAGLPDQLPARSLQTTSQTASFLKLAVMLPSAIALLMPFLLVAERLANSEIFRATLNGRPGVAAQLVIGLAFWTLLFAWPLKRLAQSFARMRTVTLDADTIFVTDGGLFSQHSWQAPISDFTGIAHNIRTSLSGVRHELVLVHPSRELSVLLAIAPRITQPEIDRICALLLCPEVPSKELYNFRLPAITWPRLVRAAAAPQPAL